LRISRSTAASSLQALDSPAMFQPQSIQLAHVLSAEVLEEVTAHQFVAKCDEDPFFDLLAADRESIGARAT
jgi:hypothetical protein